MRLGLEESILKKKRLQEKEVLNGQDAYWLAYGKWNNPNYREFLKK